MATIVVSKEVIDMITIVLSKEDCYLSLPDFYEMLAYKVSKHNGGSRPTIDCRKIRITKSVYDELKRCLKETYNMTPLEITSLFLIYGPKPDLPEQENTPYMATWEE